MYDSAHNKKRGGVVHTQNNQAGTSQGVAAEIITIPISPRRGFATQGTANRGTANHGFTIEDILWALGIWSAIICLSPVIVFYMLMVA